VSPKAAAKPGLLLRRWRMIGAGLVGAAAAPAALAWLDLPPGLSVLIGWNAAGVFYLCAMFRMLLTDDEANVRMRAKWEDEGLSATMTIVIGAVVASLAATVLALKESKAAAAHAPVAPPWAWIFSVSTLIISWLVVQVVFALHYAHRYFGDADGSGEPNGGVVFPGEAPRSYHDFIYMAVCIGASAQVSDFNITTTSLRRLVTTHALLAFFFNTMILALGINILATIISG
jgi:uncharacterized membrane protein